MEDYLPDLPAHLTEGTNVARVYLHVRDGIISGALRSGDKLGEAALAAELGVSRTPLREALGRLAADGLVVQQSPRVTVVAAIGVVAVVVAAALRAREGLRAAFG